MLIAVAGIEPTSQDSKSCVLPLDYTAVCNWQGNPQHCCLTPIQEPSQYLVNRLVQRIVLEL